ncbi:MAG: leucine-rich repeat domain-containing protein, partial [Methanomassiliicoccaceae archaeon]|nr:leucine-rich repeat domain-containing protein [Methanomassiliicoccaceae archaeon]
MGRQKRDNKSTAGAGTGERSAISFRSFSIAVAVAIIMMAALAMLNFIHFENDGNEYQNLGNIGEKFDDGMFEYKVTFESDNADERTVMITGRLPALEAEVIGNGGSLRLPSAPVIYNGKEYNVTAIEDAEISIVLGGLGGVFEAMTSIKSIDFGSVSYIGALVFSKCTSLKELSFTNTAVTHIADSAFWDCVLLESVDFTDSAVTCIDVAAFRNCASLKSVDFTNSAVTDIRTRAFDGCTSLRSVDLNGSMVKEIEYYAFAGCSSLEYVYIPSSVTSILTRAFDNCSSIKIMTVPQALEASMASALYDGKVDLFIFSDAEINNVTTADIGGRIELFITDIKGNVPVTIEIGTSAGGNDLNGTLSYAGGIWSFNPGANSAVYLKLGKVDMTGTVSDNKDVPIENAVLSYEIYRLGNTAAPDTDGHVTTDAYGNYKIIGVPLYAK